MTNNKELMGSEEFNNALLEGVEYKKNILTSYKSQNKTNFERFEDVMHSVDTDVQHIEDKKKKNRTEDDQKKLKDFKKYVSSIYKQTQDMCVVEKLEEGQKSKVQKIVEKVVPVIYMLKYIGNDALEKEFQKNGIDLTFKQKLEDKYPILQDPAKKVVMQDIFTNATSIKQKMLDDNDKITSEVYQTKVPADLQYDKKANNTGLKRGDFLKLVNLKTKLVMATSDEAKEKAEEMIENLAGEKQFEAARAELVRDKLAKL